MTPAERLIQLARTQTYFEQYNTFADACDIPKGHINEAPNQAAITLAKTLVYEEYQKELVPALLKFENAPSLENLVEVADGIADTIYVLCQLARALDVPLDAVWRAVHSSNLRKVGDDGKVHRREDGKILKPEGWEAPKIFPILLEYSNQRAVLEKSHGAANWGPGATKPLKDEDDWKPYTNQLGK